jgi:hypothetical protein
MEEEPMGTAQEMTHAGGFAAPATHVVMVDHSKDDSPWWEAARHAPNAPYALRAIFWGFADVAMLDAHATEQARTWCEQIPGWTGEIVFS